MKIRIVEGEEKERLLNAKQSAGLDYGPYLDALAKLKVGDVAAIEINGNERREKVRFQKAAVQLQKRLLWLPNPSEHEIAFEVVPFQAPLPRNRRIGGRRNSP